MPESTYHNLESVGAASAEAQTFFVYKSADGQTHVVDREGLVPRSAHHVKRVTLTGNQAQSLAYKVFKALPGDMGAKALAILHQSGWDAGTQEHGAEVGQAAAGMGGAAETVSHEVPKLGVTVVPLLLLAGGVLLAAVVFKPLRGILLKVGVSVLGLGLLFGVYLNWMTQRAGMQQTGLATPQTVIQQAEDAATQVRKSMAGQQQALEQIHE